MDTSPFNRVEINGAPARADDLRFIATVNYGHFTSMQVRYQSVRGLNLHLDRLERSTRELFGCGLDRERVRSWIRGALRDREEPASVRVNVYSRSLKSERLNAQAEPDIMVTVSPGASAATTAISVQSFEHQRVLPHIKHVGTFEVLHHRRRAQQNGFDDALFVDSSGHIAEGATWNIGFFDGQRVIWPRAPMLVGITMQLLQAGLQARGIGIEARKIHLDDVGSFRSVFLANSTTPYRPISRINGTAVPADLEFIKLAHDCYDATSWDSL
jgi:branched-subunit amino acid aminotransferase/4-amino-4-deoxychorismate lyase